MSDEMKRKMYTVYAEEEVGYSFSGDLFAETHTSLRLQNSMKVSMPNYWSCVTRQWAYSNQALVPLQVVCALLILRQRATKWLGGCGSQLVVVDHPHV